MNLTYRKFDQDSRDAAAFDTVDDDDEYGNEKNESRYNDESDTEPGERKPERM